MKEFARICVALPDDGHIASKLERVLNSEVAIKDPTKGQTLVSPEVQSKKLEDYQTLDPLVIAQPDFIYLPAPQKLAMIEKYHALKRELEKTRDMKKLLEYADRET